MDKNGLHQIFCMCSCLEFCTLAGCECARSNIRLTGYRSEDQWARNQGVCGQIWSIKLSQRLLHGIEKNALDQILWDVFFLHRIFVLRRCSHMCGVWMCSVSFLLQRKCMISMRSENRNSRLPWAHLNLELQQVHLKRTEKPSCMKSCESLFHVALLWSTEREATRSFAEGDRCSEYLKPLLER